MVMLSGKNIRTSRQSKKLDHRFYGLFQILAAVGTQAYRFDLPESMQLLSVFHVSRSMPQRMKVCIEAKGGHTRWWIIVRSIAYKMCYLFKSIGLVLVDLHRVEISSAGE